jgi:hypothetical protein
MPVAVTGVQKCERLVGVARQFEVYCAGYHGPRRTGILGLIQIPDAIYNLDNVMLPYLISTINHLCWCPGHGRAAAPFLRILLGVICAGMAVVSGTGQRSAMLFRRVQLSLVAGVEGLGSAVQIDILANQQAELRGTAVEPAGLADGAEKVRSTTTLGWHVRRQSAATRWSRLMARSWLVSYLES